jgi:hypothetical protein
VSGLLSPLGLALFAALGLAFGVVGYAVGARGLGAMVLGGLELAFVAWVFLSFAAT